MATQVETQKKLHFVIIPFKAQGHLIPLIDIARLLAKRNVTITIVTTPLNAIRFNSIIDRDIESGLPIQVLHLQFPNSDAELPDGCESIDTLPSLSLLKNFMHALSLLRQPFEQLFQELKPRPNCTVSDKNVLWSVDVARKFGVPTIVFDGLSCFAGSCIHSLHVSKVHESVVSESEPFVIPGLPDRIEIMRAQLSGAFNPGPHHFFKLTREKVIEAEEGAYGLVVNSFEELELEYVKECKKTTKTAGKKVWCVGPVSFCNDDDLDKAQRGNLKASNNEEEYYLKWLDSWGPRSVIYACLGSLSRLIPHQQVELGLGLEESKRPFIWVIRGGYKSEEFEKWLKKDGFEERVKGQGLLIRGWAPQVLILSHPSIGAFLTHCGWNSTLEGICAGVPLVTWPLFAEQFYNEKFIVQISKIGVGVGAQKVVHHGDEEKFGVLVKRDQITEAIDKVMDTENDGEETRKRAQKLAEAAKRAVQEGGSSYVNITLLLEDIKNLCVTP